MSSRAAILKKIDLRIAAIRPVPLQDQVVGRAGEAHREIAWLFQKLGDLPSAALWFQKGAGYCQSIGDVIGAITLIKQSLRLQPHNPPGRLLYASLWAAAGFGDPPENP